MNHNEISQVESLIDDGYITRRKHPRLDLYLLNYTRKTQWEANWNPVTEMCRGMIVDGGYNTIANSFPKFFNLGERMELGNLPDELPVITEKLDGFLGILYDDNGLPAISTRGSFESQMAIWATEWIRSTGLAMEDFMSNFTYLFEIIEPALCREHGMIVDYGARAECVLLAVRNTITGEEVCHESEAINLNLSFAQEYEGTLESAVAEMPIMGVDDSEGFVCKYSNGLRIKLKSDEYKRLHRLLKGLSPKRILTTLIERGDEGITDILEGVPDETFSRVHRIISQIHEDQARTIHEARKVYDIAIKLPTRQEQAEVINISPYSGIVFAMIDGKDCSAMALKRVRKVVSSLGE